MPDHGREPCFPCESGKKERRRIQKARRFNRAAVFNLERTSTTSHPYSVKNKGTFLRRKLELGFPFLDLLAHALLDHLQQARRRNIDDPVIEGGYSREVLR